MKALSRIEKSATRKGEYVGYCNGAQRIRRGGLGWQCYSLGSSQGTPIFATAGTLRDLDAKLESIAQEVK